MVLCNKVGSRKFDFIMKLLSSVSFLACMWFLLMIIAIAKHPEVAKDFVLAVFVVAALHFTITEGIIKHTLIHLFGKRIRPYAAHPQKIRAIGRRFSDSSFPSSHMATTVAMLFVIVSFYPSLFLVAIPLAFLMAFSRLHNGMHYPSDLLAGTVLGIAYGVISLYLVR